MQTTQPNIDKRRLSPDDVRKVAPALEAYTQERLYGEVWKRPGLAPRDRSLVTIAALIARDQSPALTYYFDQALENGVKPREISEIITHLAFYVGQAAQLPYHLNRAMDHGLTQPEAAEALTHLAFYTGWPSVFSALPVAKDVFDKRPR